VSDSTPSQPSRRMMMKSALAAGAGAVAANVIGCSQTHFDATKASADRSEAERFVAEYNREYQKHYTRANDAQWVAATDVTEEHTKAATEAVSAMDKFVGEKARMEKIATLRERAWTGSPLVSRQLERAWMAAAHAPGTIPELVQQRTAAEAKQAAAMNGFEYKLAQGGGAPKVVTANDIDEILLKSNNLDERLVAWESSKQLGVAMRPGLTNLRELRNKVGRELKFNSLLDLEVTDDGLSIRELMDLMRTTLEQTRPLYEQIHCYAKHTLAKRYGQPPPRRIPAHWLPNRWGQEWPGIEEGVNLDPLFADKTPEWIIKQAETFYVSMGFSPLPASFWTASDLYEVPAGATRKKNRHASAWHINLEYDVRSLMSVKPNAWWFETTHHELGHIYYYLAYTQANQPLILRNGANGAFHEAIGDLISLAASQRPYLAETGLLKGNVDADPTRWLLANALEGSIVFLPFTCGVMTGWEYEIYEKDLPANQWNEKWWELVRVHQGIDPPQPRGEDYCDAASKTHINDTPAYYYRYAVGTLIKHQLHDYIARNILKQDPRACSYYNRRDVGEYLNALLSLGASRDWRAVLRDFTGEPLSARALMAYYEPLLEYLKKENSGKEAGFA